MQENFSLTVTVSTSQGQYWTGRTPPPNNPPPNMAAANFVVMTNGEGARLMEQPLPQYWSTNNVLRAFFPRVAIGYRLSLKNRPELVAILGGGGLIRGYMIWYDVNRRYGIWIEYLYRFVVDLYKYFFSQLIIDTCNSLPAKLNDFSSLARFTCFVRSADLSQYVSLGY